MAQVIGLLPPLGRPGWSSSGQRVYLRERFKDPLCVCVRKIAHLLMCGWTRGCCVHSVTIASVVFLVCI